MDFSSFSSNEDAAYATTPDLSGIEPLDSSQEKDVESSKSDENQGNSDTVGPVEDTRPLGPNVITEQQSVTSNNLSVQHSDSESRSRDPVSSNTQPRFWNQQEGALWRTMASVPGGPPMASGAADMDVNASGEERTQNDRAQGARPRGTRVQLFRDQVMTGSPDGAASGSVGFDSSQAKPPPPDVIQGQANYRQRDMSAAQSVGSAAPLDLYALPQRPGPVNRQGYASLDHMYPGHGSMGFDALGPEGQENVGSASAALPGSSGNRSSFMNTSSRSMHSDLDHSLTFSNNANELYEELRTAMISGPNGAAAGIQHPSVYNISGSNHGNLGTGFVMGNIHINEPEDNRDSFQQEDMVIHQARPADPDLGAQNMNPSPEDDGQREGDESVESGMYVHGEQELSGEFLPLENDEPEGAGSSTQSSEEDELDYEDNTEVDQDVVLQPEADQTSYDGNNEQDQAEGFDHAQAQNQFQPISAASSMNGNAPVMNIPRNMVGNGGGFMGTGFSQNLGNMAPLVAPAPGYAMPYFAIQQHAVLEGDSQERIPHGNGNTNPEEDQNLPDINQNVSQAQGMAAGMTATSGTDNRSVDIKRRQQPEIAVSQPNGAVGGSESSMQSQNTASQQKGSQNDEKKTKQVDRHQDLSPSLESVPSSGQAKTITGQRPKSGPLPSTNAGKQHTGGATAKIPKPSNPVQPKRTKIRTVPPKVLTSAVTRATAPSKTKPATNVQPKAKPSSKGLRQNAPNSSAHLRGGTNAKSPNRAPPQRQAPSGGDSSTAPIVQGQGQFQAPLSHGIQGQYVMAGSHAGYPPHGMMVGNRFSMQVPSRDRGRDGADGFLRPNPIGEPDQDMQGLGQQTSQQFILPVRQNPSYRQSGQQDHISSSQADEDDDDGDGDGDEASGQTQASFSTQSLQGPSDSRNYSLPQDRHYLDHHSLSQRQIPGTSLSQPPASMWNQPMGLASQARTGHPTQQHITGTGKPPHFSTNFYYTQQSLPGAQQPIDSTHNHGRKPDVYGPWNRSLELSPISGMSTATNRIQFTMQPSPNATSSVRENPLHNMSFASMMSDKPQSDQHALMTSDLAQMDQITAQVRSMLAGSGQAGLAQYDGPYDGGSQNVNSSTVDLSELERERCIRKHCEAQIEDLQKRVLDLQQQLAVASSTERRKDTMIQQLDKTLSQVMENWKKKEAEKQNYIQKLKQESDELRAKQRQQQELSDRFEQELGETLDQLAQEQQRSNVKQQEQQKELEVMQQENTQLAKALETEQKRVHSLEGNRNSLEEERDTLSTELMETQEKYEQATQAWQEQEKSMHQKIEEQTGRLGQQTQTIEDLQTMLGATQQESQALQLELNTTHRERESLKVQMGLLEAKSESQLRKQEAHLQGEFEKEISEKLEEERQLASEREEELRERHRRQVMELNQRHSQETEASLRHHQGELKRSEETWKREIQERDDKIELYQQDIENYKVRHEQQRAEVMELTSRLQSMMQSHCDEALRLLQLGNQARLLATSGSLLTHPVTLATTNVTSASSLKTSVLESVPQRDNGSSNVERYLHSLQPPGNDERSNQLGGALLHSQGGTAENGVDTHAEDPCHDLHNQSDLTQIPMNHSPSLSTSLMSSVSMATGHIPKMPTVSEVQKAMFPDLSSFMSQAFGQMQAPQTSTVSNLNPQISNSHKQTSQQHRVHFQDDPTYYLSNHSNNNSIPMTTASQWFNQSGSSTHNSTTNPMSLYTGGGPTIMLHPPVQRDYSQTSLLSQNISNQSQHSSPAHSTGSQNQGEGHIQGREEHFEPLAFNTSMNTSASSDLGYPSQDGARSLFSHILQQHMSGQSLGDNREHMSAQSLDDNRELVRPEERAESPHQSIRLNESLADAESASQRFESRQAELQHYIKMLLTRAPGKPLDDPLDETLQSQQHNVSLNTAPHPPAITKTTVPVTQGGSAPGGPGAAFFEAKQEPSGVLSPLQIGEISRLLGRYGRELASSSGGASSDTSQPPMEELLSYLRDMQARPQGQHSPPVQEGAKRRKTPPSPSRGPNQPRRSSPTRPSQHASRAKKNLESNYSTAPTQPADKHVIKIPTAKPSGRVTPPPHNTSAAKPAQQNKKGDGQTKQKPPPSGKSQGNPGKGGGGKGHVWK